MKRSTLMLCRVMSRTMHVAMLFMKLVCVPVNVLVMLAVETVKVKTRHLKVIESAVEVERGTSWEV